MNESNIFGVSVRAIIAVELVSAVIACVFFRVPVDETLKYLAVSAVSFYFGTKQQSVSQITDSTKGTQDDKVSP